MHIDFADLLAGGVEPMHEVAPTENTPVHKQLVDNLDQPCNDLALVYHLIILQFQDLNLAIDFGCCNARPRQV
jgi:hypothetical protein